jgi:hypothetical protein
METVTKCKAMRTPVSTANYETFGPEWKAYVMTMKKVDIVEILATTGKDKEALQERIKELEARLELLK